MEIDFYKFHGTGNDFIIIDDRKLKFPSKNNRKIKFLCDRVFGIGSDGLILIQDSLKMDFKMIYYNSDGNKGSFCGNGARCAVSYANFLYSFNRGISFEFSEEFYSAIIGDNEISVRMSDVYKINCFKDYIFLNTGSPHHVVLVEDIDSIDVKLKGSEIRYSNIYKDKGTNVDFVQKISNNEFSIRTYERGVEDETYSCGTGATAVAIAMHKLKETSQEKIKINVKGGQLEVNFEHKDGLYHKVYLKGPVVKVYKGKIKI